MNDHQVPQWLSGAWERLYIRIHGSSPNSSINVRYAQTPTLFGDCRIPRARPEFPHAGSLNDLTDAQLETLYHQEGFSGYATVQGYVTWHHEIDYQPAHGSVDIGRIERTGGRNSFEHGVKAVYTEHWWYLESGEGRYLGVKVMRNLPDGTQRVHEILSVAGNHFTYARNRPFDLPMAPSLAELIKTTHATHDQVIKYLDCEVSHGFVMGGRQPWEIQFSTLPFRERQPLEFASKIVVDPKTGQLSHRSSPQDQIWSFPVNTLGIEDLLVLFPPSTKTTPDA